MLRNYFLINLVLIMIISVLGYNLYDVVTDKTDIPSAAAAKKAPADNAQDSAYKGKLNPAAFNVISKKDLFRPSRSSSSSSAETAKNEGVSKDLPKLFGTIIINENKTAILEDPGTKTTKTYRINDSIAGYVLTDILEEKVVFSVNGENIEVKLREDKGVKPARSVRKAPRTRTTPATRSTSRRVRRPVPVRKQPAANTKTQKNKEELDRLIEEMEKLD